MLRMRPFLPKVEAVVVSLLVVLAAADRGARCGGFLLPPQPPPHRPPPRWGLASYAVPGSFRSRSIPTPSTITDQPRCTNSSLPIGSLSIRKNEEKEDDKEDEDDDYRIPEEEEVLSCRVLGFYPFPNPPPKGVLGWMLRDTHQAILVESSYYSLFDGGDERNKTTAKKRSRSPSRKRRKRRVMLVDFMTENSEFHPVWYDEATKWDVMLGGTIRGEIRIRDIGRKRRSNDDEGEGDDANNNTNNGNHPKMEVEEFLRIANSYDRGMNLYTNNCRIFCARMEREIGRLDNDRETDVSAVASASLDVRFLARLAVAVILPAIYPLSAIVLLYFGCRP